MGGASEYARVMIEEMDYWQHDKSHPDCVLHSGQDQGIHNWLVYSGKLKSKTNAEVKLQKLGGKYTVVSALALLLKDVPKEKRSSALRDQKLLDKDGYFLKK